VSLIIIIVLMIAESVSLILTAENPQYTKYWDVSVHFTDRHSRQKCTDNLLSIYSWGFSAYKLTDLWVHFARLWIESVYRSFSDDALSDSSECESYSSCTWYFWTHWMRDVTSYVSSAWSASQSSLSKCDRTALQVQVLVSVNVCFKDVFLKLLHCLCQMTDNLI